MPTLKTFNRTGIVAMHVATSLNIHAANDHEDYLDS